MRLERTTNGLQKSHFTARVTGLSGFEYSIKGHFLEFDSPTSVFIHELFKKIEETLLTGEETNRNDSSKKISIYCAAFVCVLCRNETLHPFILM